MITAAALVRLRLYLVNRSLWSDEARLALNLIGRSFAGLWKPLDWEQGAPVGFLTIQKAVITVLGRSEYALRLWPLLAGILSLILFYLLARKVVTAGAGLVGLGMMCVSRGLIYYSSEVKQYSTDVLVALLILLLAARCFEEIPTASRRNRILAWGAASGILLWFSHPAVFVITGAGIALFIHNRNSTRTATIAACAFAAFTFSIDFFLVLQPLHQSVYLHEFWQQGGFLPRPINLRSIAWLWQTFFRAFRTPGGFKVPVFTPLVFLIGAIVLSLRKPWLAMLMLLPPLVALAAAAADEYPYLHRLILFVLPMLFLVSGVGLSALWQLIPGPRWLVITACCLVLFAGALLAVRKWIVEPEPGEEMKPVLHYLQNHRQPDDKLIVYWAAEPALRYYSGRYGINWKDATIINAKKPADITAEVQQLPPQTGWFLINQDPSNQTRAALDRDGTELDSARSPGVSAYRIALGNLKKP